MKKTIRINERELHRLISESVKRVLNEGGNLTYKDEDGRMHSNSQRTWHGVPGSTFVWHGEWSDPEIYFEYQGEQYIINGPDAEDFLWNNFRDYCEENGINADEHSNDDVYDRFAEEEAENVLLDLGPYNESYQTNEMIIRESVKRTINEYINGDEDMNSRITSYIDDDDLDDKYGRYDGTYQTNNGCSVIINDYGNDFTFTIECKGKTLKTIKNNSIREKLDELIEEGYNISEAVSMICNKLLANHSRI